MVRRAELVAELTAEGADAVFTEDSAAVPEGARLAFNAVGGESALRMATRLADGGTIVTYGAMARQPLKIPNSLLIFNDLAWRGFWVTRWYQSATAEQRAALFAELFALTKQGVIETPVEAVYPLRDIGAALAHAQQAQRAGKILLRCSE